MFRWVCDKFKGAVKRNCDQCVTFDNVYVDCNGLVHSCLSHLVERYSTSATVRRQRSLSTRPNPFVCRGYSGDDLDERIIELTTQHLEAIAKAAIPRR